ncbi:MAG: ImmA/IrrE family metallo-endopeptidase [Gemmatimonadetes bacterium]|nr:ImmA/IrrE family metallo-endopeptidase [Gemmatimonadota bacterium]
MKPELLRWARHRAGLRRSAFPARFKKLPEWEAGRLRPTLRQLEDFARKVHVPVGTLLLDEPPEESVPIPDYRTVGSGALPQPSPNLLDTIYLCQERQAWYQDYLRSMGAEPLDFVGSLAANSDTRAAAEAMRDKLRITVDGRLGHRTPQKALSACIASAESAGVLVMVSGIVGSNPRRKLDPREFRGFALADSLAPLVFVNGLDAKSAQMFTLAHELAHLWLEISALSNLPSPSAPGIRTEEVWCNAVAAEFLGPLAASWSRKVAQHESVRRSGGGDFYRTAISRLSRPFTRAVIADTLEGRTRYTDALRMLGIRNQATLDRMAGELGLTP